MTPEFLEWLESSGIKLESRKARTAGYKVWRELTAQNNRKKAEVRNRINSIIDRYRADEISDNSQG